MSKVLVGKRKYLVENLLLVDGITRSGKFLLANILSSFKNIEPVKYYGLLEHIPFFERFGLMDKETSKELLHCEIDFHCYETLIGRNLNYRRSDKSSIHNNPYRNLYSKRGEQENIDLLLKNFHKKKPYSFFITHELLPHLEIYLETFPNIKVLVIERNVTDLVYSWWKRGIGTRIGKDPTMFQIPLRINSRQAVPWYALSLGGKYYSLPEIDRIIFSIATLKKLYRKAYHKLTEEQKNKIMFVEYDEVLVRPKHVIQKISKFLGNKISPKDVKYLLTKENLPNAKAVQSRATRREELRKIASKKYFLELLKLEKETSLMAARYH